jgi:hypothetical protein
VFRGVDVAFDIVARDTGSCSELTLLSTSVPHGAVFTPAQDVSSTWGAGTSRQRRFSFPSPNTGYALLDTRPALSVVCFFVSDSYVVGPDYYCVDIVINPIPPRPEQVLVRFGCHMGLLWNPAPAAASGSPAVRRPAGRFCFFDADSDFDKPATITTLCSACTYATHSWHHAYITVSGAGAGRLYVDGEVQRQFTTARRPYDCSRDLPVAAGKRRRTLGLDGGAGGGGTGSGFNNNGDYGEAESSLGRSAGVDSMSIGGMRRLTAATAAASNCSCSLRVAAECSVGFRGFRGLSDEVTVHRRAISAAETRRMMFAFPTGAHPAAAAHSPPQGSAAGTDAFSLVAHLKFDRACAAPASVVANTLSSTAAAAGATSGGVSVIAVHAELDASPAAVVVLATAPAYPLGGTEAKGGPYRLTSAPWLPPAVTGAAHSSGGAALTHVPMDATIVNITAFGVAASAFTTCTLDRGADAVKVATASGTGTGGIPATGPAPTLRIGNGMGRHGTRNWAAAPAAFAPPEKLVYGRTGDTYWDSGQVQCAAPPATSAEKYILGVSNDGGASRAAMGVEVAYSEQALHLGGRAYVDASTALREVTAAVTVAAWIKPSAGGGAVQAVLSFLGKGQLTTGVRFLPDGAGAFGLIKQGVDFGVVTTVAAPPGR